LVQRKLAGVRKNSRGPCEAWGLRRVGSKTPSKVERERESEVTSMEQNEFEVAGSFGVSHEIALRSLDKELDEFVSTRVEPGDELQGQEVSEKFYDAAKSLSGIYHNGKRVGGGTYGHILSSSRTFKMSLTEKLRQARKE